MLGVIVSDDSDFLFMTVIVSDDFDFRFMRNHISRQQGDKFGRYLEKDRHDGSNEVSSFNKTSLPLKLEELFEERGYVVRTASVSCQDDILSRVECLDHALKSVEIARNAEQSFFVEILQKS